MTGQERSGAEIVAEHMKNCTDAQAAVVVDGSADDVVAGLVAAGWALEERVDYVAGKRVRFLRTPVTSTEEE